MHYPQRLVREIIDSYCINRYCRPSSSCRSRVRLTTSIMASFLRQVATQGNAQRPTVILGAGILGLPTAYHLAIASRNQNTPIIVADPPSEICGGASGQGEDALGEFDFDQQMEPLGKLSYRLYPKMAARTRSLTLGQVIRSIGYSSLIIHTVFSRKYDPVNPRLPFPVKSTSSSTHGNFMGICIGI